MSSNVTSRLVDSAETEVGPCGVVVVCVPPGTDSMQFTHREQVDL